MCPTTCWSFMDFFFDSSRIFLLDANTERHKNYLSFQSTAFTGNYKIHQQPHAQKHIRTHKHTDTRSCEHAQRIVTLSFLLSLLPLIYPVRVKFSKPSFIIKSNKIFNCKLLTVSFDFSSRRK